MSNIDLVETEAAQHGDAGCVLLPGLALDERKVLVVIVAEDVAKQQPGKPLTAKGLVHLDMQNADGVLVPASAERVHLPNERTPSRPLAHLLLQPKALDLQGTAHALLIPARRAAARQLLHLEAAPQRRETPVDHVERPVEMTLQDQLRLDDAIAAPLQERPDCAVAFEEPWRLASAIDAEGERVERGHR